jgi:hypothetical protein
MILKPVLRLIEKKKCFYTKSFQTNSYEKIKLFPQQLRTSHHRKTTPHSHQTHKEKQLRPTPSPAKKSKANRDPSPAPAEINRA